MTDQAALTETQEPARPGVARWLAATLLAAVVGAVMALWLVHRSKTNLVGPVSATSPFLIAAALAVLASRRGSPRKSGRALCFATIARSVLWGIDVAYLYPEASGHPLTGDVLYAAFFIPNELVCWAILLGMGTAFFAIVGRTTARRPSR